MKKDDDFTNLIKRKSKIYQQRAFILLEVSWLIWLIISLVGLAITIIQLTLSDQKTIIAVLGGVTSLLALIQSKWKPHKRGYRYKLSANELKQLLRRYQNLQQANLTPEQYSAKLEEIYQAVDRLDIDLYIDKSPEENLEHQIV